MDIPKWFTDLVEEIKRRHRTDDALASLIVSVDRQARMRHVSDGKSFADEVRKAVTHASNPRKIEDLWRRFRKP